MDIFSIFLNMNVCCVFSLEPPHRGDSNEYTQYTIFNIKMKITLNYPRSEAVGFCSKGLKNYFETAVVNEPSVFEPSKFYGIYIQGKLNRLCESESSVIISFMYPLLPNGLNTVDSRYLEVKGTL